MIDKLKVDDRECMYEYRNMPKQITVTLADHDYDLLQLVVEESGKSQSSIAAQCISDGLFMQLEKLNKAEAFKVMVEQRKVKKDKK